MRGKGILLILLLVAGLLVLGRSRWRLPSAWAPASRPDTGEEVPGAVSAGDAGSPFAEDRGGQLLADLLPPREALPPLPSDLPAGPLRFRIPPALERMELPGPPNQAAPPSLPNPPSRPFEPQALGEEFAGMGPGSDPEPPQRPKLLAGPRLRGAAGNRDEPLPLPYLSPRPAERTWADDPLTGEASAAAALAVKPVPRIRPAPLLRSELADPSRRRRAAALPAEYLMPVTGAPRLPRR